MLIYHKHHIIPKHKGGTDDSSNLVMLTIEEHAEAHRKLWEQDGDEYDRIAWLGLSGMIGKDEIVKKVLIENGKRNVKAFTKDQQSRGGKTSSQKYPEKSSLGGKALWSNDEMRKHLSEKRVEQSRLGKNPMQGKKQKRVCCLCCKLEFSYNKLVVHQKKTSVDSVSTPN